MRNAALPLLLVAAAVLSSVARADDPIRVGQFGAFTGKEAAFGVSARKGAILAIEEVNAAGGVLGRKIELITEDNQSKQGESATIVKKFVARDHVVAVLGGNASANSLEAAPICQTAHVPMIAISSTDPKVTQMGDYIFRVCFIDPFQGAVLARFATETLKVKNVAVLTSMNSPYSVGLSRVFRERFFAGGGKIAADQRYSEGDKDFRAQLTAIKAAGAEAILASGYYTEAALICKQARALGLTVPIFGGDGWEAPELLSIGGPAVEGTYYSASYTSESTSPEVVAFVQRFHARWDETPDSIAALGYDAAMLLVDALKRAGSAEGAALRTALASTRDFPGVTGRTTIDAQRNASKSAVIITVKEGKFAYVRTVEP
ncbi:MAG TPA: ABC transporter substrate-binding protein [Candidatus Didemnitutus sp.]|nr:ABC transporter substrate-binding protein [Candidatus Didemnitutus sp.]